MVKKSSKPSSRVREQPRAGIAGEGVTVWKFEEAPEDYRALSQHGGDEDWLAFVPNPLKDEWIGWMQEGTSFGCCSVTEYPVIGGVVRIGAHA